MNFNPQVPPLPAAPNNNLKKLQENLDVTDLICEVVSASCFIREFTSKNGGGKYKQEVFEILLGILDQDGKLTETALTKKIRGANIDVNGNQGEIPAYLWDVLNIIATQKPGLMQGAVQAVKYNEPCMLYPNMNGARLHVLIATTGKFNGYNCYTTEIFNPGDKASGREIAAAGQPGVVPGVAYATARKRMQAEREKFKAGSAAGWGGQSNQFGFNNAPASAPAPSAPGNGFNRPPVGNYQGGFNAPAAAPSVQTAPQYNAAATGGELPF